MEKHSVSRLSYLFAHLHLLSSDSFSSDLLSSNLSLFSASSLLCFSSVHIVGSLTSKLPSIIVIIIVIIIIIIIRRPLQGGVRQRSRGFANLLVAIFLPDLYVSLQSLGPLGVHRIWRIWSLWGPVSLAALFLPISLCIP